LDSFAMLAYLGGEAGMERVRALLQECTQGKCRALFSLINLGEVIYIVEREHGLTKAQEVLATFDQLPVQVLPATRAGVLAAAHIKANYPIAFADAFVVATALEQQAAILTGDPEFEAVSRVVQVDWLPK
jgi:ribonuclease VapC